MTCTLQQTVSQMLSSAKAWCIMFISAHCCFSCSIQISFHIKHVFPFVWNNFFRFSHPSRKRQCARIRPEASPCSPCCSIGQCIWHSRLIGIRLSGILSPRCCKMDLALPQLVTCKYMILTIHKIRFEAYTHISWQCCISCMIQPKSKVIYWVHQL